MYLKNCTYVCLITNIYGYSHCLYYFCVFVTSAKEVTFFVVVCMLATLHKTSKRICMKFSEKVGNGSMNKR